MKHNALVVIDVQNGFINKHSACVPSRIKRLVERNIFDDVLFTQFINNVGSPFDKVLNWHKLRKKNEIEIVSSLQGCATNIFVKHGYSAFTPQFERYLQKKGISTLYFTGIDTDVCVMKSAVDAFERRLLPVVLGYYCASHGGRQYHQSALKILGRCIGVQNVIRSEIQSEHDLSTNK